jgi:hypothetical protein
MWTILVQQHSVRSARQKLSQLRKSRIQRRRRASDCDKPRRRCGEIEHRAGDIPRLAKPRSGRRMPGPVGAGPLVP